MTTSEVRQRVPRLLNRNTDETTFWRERIPEGWRLGRFESWRFWRSINQTSEIWMGEQLAQKFERLRSFIKKTDLKIAIYVNCICKGGLWNKILQPKNCSLPTHSLVDWKVRVDLACKFSHACIKSFPSHWAQAILKMCLFHEETIEEGH